MNSVEVRKHRFPDFGLLFQLMGTGTLIAALFVKNPLFLTFAFPMGLTFLMVGFIFWVIYIVSNDKIPVKFTTKESEN